MPRMRLGAARGAATGADCAGHTPRAGAEAGRCFATCSGARDALRAVILGHVAMRRPARVSSFRGLMAKLSILAALSCVVGLALPAKVLGDRAPTPAELKSLQAFINAQNQGGNRIETI